MHQKKKIHISKRKTTNYWWIKVSITIKITETGENAAARRVDGRNKGVILKNCVPFTKCISKINNTETDSAQDIDIVIPMYNLIEYSNQNILFK